MCIANSPFWIFLGDIHGETRNIHKIKDVQNAIDDTSDSVQTQSASLYHEKDTRKGVFFVVAALYE